MANNNNNRIENKKKALDSFKKIKPFLENPKDRKFLGHTDNTKK